MLQEIRQDVRVVRMAKSRKSSQPNSTETVPELQLETGGAVSGVKVSTDVVRIESDLARKLAIASTILQKTVSELLSPYVRDWVEELYADAIRKAAQEVKPDRK